jgi:hypothetical protein
MTNANMKLVLANVLLEDKLELHRQKLEVGEFIVPRIVELAALHEELKGKSIWSFMLLEISPQTISQNTLERFKDI